MSLITDDDWVIQQLRIEFLRSEDPCAERMIQFSEQKPINGDGLTSSVQPLSPIVESKIFDQYIKDESEESPYLQDLFPEKNLCYSPNIQHIVLETAKSVKTRRFDSSRQKLSPQKDSKSEKRKHPAENTTSKTKAVSDSTKHTSTPPSSPLQFSKRLLSNNSKSLLSEKMKTNAVVKNPFSLDFSFVCGTGVPNPIRLKIFFPHSNLHQVPIEIIIKRDSSVEEVIGYSLFMYVENGREPLITRESTPYNNVSAWNLRIVEDDGEIDNDFPALVRIRKIQQFQFDRFAVCLANPGHLKMNAAELSKKPSQHINRTQTVAKTSAANFFIKVHLYSTLEVKQTTTISLPGDMLLSDVLIYCCRKRKIEPNDYTLKMADTKTDIPLNKTLESLGIMELCLLKKDRGPSAGDIFLRPPDETETDTSELQVPAYISDEATSIYKKYIVIKKATMIMGKQERVFAIDGDFIYIMPPENKNIFDNVKPISVHISHVVSCKTVKQSYSSFKLVTMVKDKDNKTYEFEAANPQEAQEICAKINFISQFHQGNLTARKGISLKQF